MRSSDNGHLTRYAPRVETGSTETLKPASGVHRGKYRRRPPTSEAEQQRRKEWGAKWSKLNSEAWKRSQVRGA